MYKWSDEQEMVRSIIRDFIDKEIRPHREALEFGDMPPYDVLRKFFATFGMDQMARDGFTRRIEREKAALAAAADPADSANGSGARADTESDTDGEADAGARDAGGFMMIAIIELCRVCPGLVTAMGVSMGLTAAAVNAKGTIAQRERWAVGRKWLRADRQGKKVAIAVA